MRYFLVILAALILAAGCSDDGSSSSADMMGGDGGSDTQAKMCSAVTTECVFDYHCPAGVLCVVGECVTGPVACDDLCAPTENTLRDCMDIDGERQCVRLDCAINEHCPERGQICSPDGYCVPSETTCASSVDCEGGLSCYSGTCTTPECAGDEECPEGSACSSGICRSDQECEIADDACIAVHGDGWTCDLTARRCAAPRGGSLAREPSWYECHYDSECDSGCCDSSVYQCVN